VSFQPSELAKWAVVIFLAAFLSRFSQKKHSFTGFFLIAAAVPAIAVSLIVSEDFGTAAFIAILALLMLWLGGAVWWHLLVPMLVAVPGFITAILVSPTRIKRVTDFLDPDVISYQAHQSLLAISSGQWFGRGLGRGVLKYGHLPEDTTDFIFSIVCEELGFAGAIMVIILFVLFLVLGLRVAMRSRDPFAKLLSAGIVLAIVLQAAINIGVVTVVLPTKGIPLPLISAGGTSMLLTAAAVGILLNIARTTIAEAASGNKDVLAGRSLGAAL
jgi:cell division protein FtsW